MEQSDIRNNCINLFRLIAALEVVYTHAISHLQLTKLAGIDEAIRFFNGVPMFLTLSGFLIWFSVERSHSYKDYLKKRFWRIFPELWLAVLVEIVVILLLYKEPVDYAKLGLFTITQGTVFQFWTPNCLRGYGCGTPNCALWTICVLIQFYVVAFIIHKWLKNGRLYLWMVVIAITVLIGALSPYLLDRITLYSVNLGRILAITIFPYLWMFIIPAFVADKIEVILPVLKRCWWVIMLIALFSYILHVDISTGTNVYGIIGLVESVFLFLTIIAIGYKFPQLTIKKDISYGIYIYHVTIINALRVLGYTGNYWLLLLTIVATCLLAWLSTVTIGSFSSLKRKKY